MINSCFPRYPVSIQLGLEHLTWLKSANACIECLRRRYITERSKIIDGLPVEAVIDTGQLQECPDLAGEHKPAFGWCIKKRLDAKTVPGQNQSVGPGVVNCQGEHPAQLGHKGRPFFLVEVWQYFGIRVPFEYMAAGFQVATE